MRNRSASSSSRPVKFEEVPLAYDGIESQVKFLQGKVLTIIEAAITSPEQLKAVKSIINTTFCDQLGYIFELTHPEVEYLSEHRTADIDWKEVDKAVERGKSNQS